MNGSRTQSVSKARGVAPQPSREDVLRAGLLPTVEFLRRRRADLIDMALVEDYIKLNWMEWQGGSLRLTETGRNICAQLTAKLR